MDYNRPLSLSTTSTATSFDGHGDSIFSMHPINDASTPLPYTKSSVSWDLKNYAYQL